ncbi:hypothetical protein GCM10027570_11330 [Streptomonospora sediminis]
MRTLAPQGSLTLSPIVDATAPTDDGHTTGCAPGGAMARGYEGEDAVRRLEDLTLTIHDLGYGPPGAHRAMIMQK